MTATATLPAPPPTALAGLSVTATSEEWMGKLRAVGAAVNSRPPIPILNCVKISSQGGKVSLSAYDYETSAVAQLKPESGRISDADALVSMSWLARTIRTLTARKPKALVTVAVGEIMGQSLITVSAEGYTIPVVNHYKVEEYPAAPEHGIYGTFIMDRRLITAAMDRAIVAASMDDTLPILTAVSLEGTGQHLQIHATDRYRLTSERIPHADGVPEFVFLMQAATWKAMARHLGGDLVTVNVLAAGDQPGRFGGNTALTIESGDVAYTLTSVAGEYPKIASLFLDNYTRHIEVDRRTLMEQVNIANDICPRNTPAHVLMSASTITVRPTLDEAAGAIVTPLLPATVNGAADWTDDPTVGLNPSYFLQALRSMDSENVRLSFSASMKKPVCVTAGGVPGGRKDTYRHLIMPVRVPDQLGDKA